MDEAQVKSIDLFASLSGKERKLIASQADEVDVAEGEQLVREGEFAYEFFVILEGTADGDARRRARRGPRPGRLPRRDGDRRPDAPQRVGHRHLADARHGDERADLRGIMRQMPAAADRIMREIEDRCRR